MHDPCRCTGDAYGQGRGAQGAAADLAPDDAMKLSQALEVLHKL